MPGWVGLLSSIWFLESTSLIPKRLLRCRKILRSPLLLIIAHIAHYHSLLRHCRGRCGILNLRLVQKRCRRSSSGRKCRSSWRCPTSSRSISNGLLETLIVQIIVAIVLLLWLLLLLLLWLLRYLLRIERITLRGCCRSG